MDDWRLPNMRRCHSTPPWSLPDITPDFWSRLPQLPFLKVDDELLQGYEKIDVWMQLPRSSILLLDDKYVLKLMPAYWDVDTIVHNMRLARTVVPVPKVHKFGRSGTSTYIIMDRVHGYRFRAVTDSLGHYAAVRLKTQISDIVIALATVGLAHYDLHPRNIIVDENYVIQAVLDWDFACSISRLPNEYFYRVRYGRMPKEYDESWNSLFLRVVDNRADVETITSESTSLRLCPPASTSWQVPSSKVVCSDLSRRNSCDGSVKRIAFLVSGKSETWKSSLKTVLALKNIRICVFITDDAVNALYLRSVSQTGIPIRILNPASAAEVYRALPKIDPPASSTLDFNLAHIIAEFRSQAVYLCNWSYRLGVAFWAMAQVPPVLDPATLMWIVSVNDEHTDMTFVSLAQAGAHTIFPGVPSLGLSTEDRYAYFRDSIFCLADLLGRP